MPEHLRALLVILALATVIFALARLPACALASTPRDFKRRRNLWFAVTVTAFLANNFWIYIIVAAVLLQLALPREPNKLAMFFFLLFAVPMFSAEIGGLGVVRYLFAIDYFRLLALLILLPTFLSLRKQSDNDPFGRSVADKLLAGYLILQFLLMLTVSTFTNTLRYGALYAFIDVFLPYYVASRSLRDILHFRDALMAFAVAALVLAAIGAFEFVQHWLLYAALQNVLGGEWGLGSYLGRGESLRALGSTGQPIPLGYAMAVALGFWLYLKKSIPNHLVWNLGLMALIVGLVAPLSRGPWIGAVAILLVFIGTSSSPLTGFGKLGLFALISLPLLLMFPAGKVILDHMPFVGTVDAENVTYRQRLLDIAIGVIMQNPLFGAFEFMYSPAMQELRQGQGIIDVVNTYLGVGLSSGLVGLALYTGFFVALFTRVANSIWNLPDRNSELCLLGRALLSTLIGILIIIFTVASITIIPVIYWSVAGMCVAYARMVDRERSSAK